MKASITDTNIFIDASIVFSGDKMSKFNIQTLGHHV